MSSMTPTIRPLQANDELPLGEGGTTVRGYVAELEGKIVGVMGVMHLPVAPIAFSEVRPELRKYPKTIVRAIRLFRELLDDHYTCVFAAASLQEESTFRTLSHAGFKPHTTASEDHRGVWVWHKQ